MSFLAHLLCETFPVDTQWVQDSQQHVTLKYTDVKQFDSQIVDDTGARLASSSCELF